MQWCVSLFLLDSSIQPTESETLSQSPKQIHSLIFTWWCFRMHTKVLGWHASESRQKMALSLLAQRHRDRASLDAGSTTPRVTANVAKLGTRTNPLLMLLSFCLLGSPTSGYPSFQQDLDLGLTHLKCQPMMTSGAHQEDLKLKRKV